MNKKLFIFLVVLLSSLIVASLIWLLISINTYNRSKYPQEKPSYFSDTKKEDNKEENKQEVDTALDQPTNTIDDKTYKVDSTETKQNDKLFGETVIELKQSDIEGLDYETLNQAYNAIFARHGHDFKSKNLKDFFSKFSWYKPIDDKTVSLKDLSELENKNLNLIKSQIDKVKAQ